VPKDNGYIIEIRLEKADAGLIYFTGTLLYLSTVTESSSL
jgi:hypothetical protein